MAILPKIHVCYDRNEETLIVCTIGLAQHPSDIPVIPKLQDLVRSFTQSAMTVAPTFSCRERNCFISFIMEEDKFAHVCMQVKVPKGERNRIHDKMRTKMEMVGIADAVCKTLEVNWVHKLDLYNWGFIFEDVTKQKTEDNLEFYASATEEEMTPPKKSKFAIIMVLGTNKEDVTVYLHEPTAKGQPVRVVKDEWIKVLFGQCIRKRTGCHLKKVIRLAQTLMKDKELPTCKSHLNPKNKESAFLFRCVEVSDMLTKENGYPDKLSTSEIQKVCDDINNEDGTNPKRKSTKEGQYSNGYAEASHLSTSEIRKVCDDINNEDGTNPKRKSTKEGQYSNGYAEASHHSDRDREAEDASALSLKRKLPVDTPGKSDYAHKWGINNVNALNYLDALRKYECAQNLALEDTRALVLDGPECVTTLSLNAIGVKRVHIVNHNKHGDFQAIKAKVDQKIIKAKVFKSGIIDFLRGPDSISYTFIFYDSHGWTGRHKEFEALLDSIAKPFCYFAVSFQVGGSGVCAKHGPKQEVQIKQKQLSDDEGQAEMLHSNVFVHKEINFFVNIMQDKMERKEVKILHYFEAEVPGRVPQTKFEVRAWYLDTRKMRNPIAGST